MNISIVKNSLWCLILIVEVEDRIELTVGTLEKFHFYIQKEYKTLCLKKLMRGTLPFVKEESTNL